MPTDAGHMRLLKLTTVSAPIVALAAALAAGTTCVATGRPAAAACSGSLGTSPTRQQVAPNQAANIQAEWSCEDFFEVTIDIDWGDGAHDGYTCHA
jgi:hypothetical protein